MYKIRVISFALSLAFIAIGFQTASAQKGQLKIDYTVKVESIEKQLFHITTDIKNIRQDRLDLALPTWTPGWYTVENYQKNFLRFRVTDASGKELPLRMSRKQTWNIDTKDIREIRVDYDYRATVLALNQAKISKDFAFFTGIELFLEPVGHAHDPSSVHFDVPQGWKIVSALKETSDPMVFTAADYDTLVDAPAQMGNFDVLKFEAEGKPHYLVSTPAGAFSAEKAKAFSEMLARVASVGSAMFGGLPYDKYIYFYFFTPPESNASGALEHLNSHVAFGPPPAIAEPDNLIGTAAHEYFHTWNVKRIRPAEMWPYDYSRENETPLLWVSEGFTNYYGNVMTYRAGIRDEKQFLTSIANAAAGVENNEARKYISPANSSVSTWNGYDTPVAFGISYYGQGQNLAALLDLSIRNDTAGRAGLDDVMRALFNDFYKKNKGFSTEDMLGVIKRQTKKDYRDFYNRYVFGTEVPDYDTVFGYAGYRLERGVSKDPVFGFSGRFRNGGFTLNAVEPNSPAEAAGLRQGDVIVKVNGENPRSVLFGDVAGKTLQLTVSRRGEEVAVPITVGVKEGIAFTLAGLPQPTTEQLKVREGWLKR